MKLQARKCIIPGIRVEDDGTLEVDDIIATDLLRSPYIRRVAKQAAKDKAAAQGDE